MSEFTNKDLTHIRFLIPSIEKEPENAYGFIQEVLDVLERDHEDKLVAFLNEALEIFKMPPPSTQALEMFKVLLRNQKLYLEAKGIK